MVEASEKLDKPHAGGAGRRSAARLGAVQVLYQLEMSDVPVDQAIAQFLTGEHPEPDGEDAALADVPVADPDLFSTIVSGVTENRAALDEIIAGKLSADWTVGRLEILVRLILEAAIYEITLRDDIPPKVSINEYLNVARAFFERAEPGLINGVLDAVAKSAGLPGKS